jgi:uncharacterized protein (TIGR00369 family)
MSNASYPSGLPREFLERAIERTPLVGWLGVKIATFEPGIVVIELPIRKELLQHHGFAHGAVIGFLADSVYAWVAASVAGDVVTSEYKINFLAPAVGEKLIARGSVIKASSRQVVCRADVFALKEGQEKIVATALAKGIA